MERMIETGAGLSTVGVWCRVIVQDVETDEKLTITIVPIDAADPFAGKVSIGAPLAAALMGRRTDESVHVEVHDGTRTFRIVKVAQGAELS